MSTLINELKKLCAEIRSDKVTSRTKAADRMDYLLTNSKEELITLCRNKNFNMEVTWTELFDSAINGTLRHAAKIEESPDLKNIQTLRNKNHIYVAIVTKIIDYSVEDDNNFISKSTLLSGFFESYAKRSALISFGTLFLYILDTGIYKCNEKVCDLNVNEFSRILSYLFEVNITNDDNMQLAVLRTINKTIELSSTHVQLITDLFDYFPTIKDYVTSATDDRRKAEVIKLYNLFVSQLSIDFHKEICSNVQELLPLICKFYSFRMKIETKESLFYSINITLNVIYPYVTNQNGYAIKVDVNDRWNKVIKSIGSIVDTEVKERKTQLYRLGDASNEKCFLIFLKMSAFITYLLHWDCDESLIDDDQPRKKVQKTADKMENILNILQPDGTTALNETWYVFD